VTDGASGWDDYAAFYDWENARTLGRRDLAWWHRVLFAASTSLGTRQRVLELGCGTGRLLLPLARAGLAMTGVDRSAPMLSRAAARIRRMPRARRPAIARGDIRALPFPAAGFGAVLAPYGMLQSLLSDRDLDATLAEVHRVLAPGGLLGVDLVPDLRVWSEYRRRVQLHGPSGRGGQITLIESVRQDRRRHLTIFDEEFVERRGSRTSRRRFSLTFRTRSMKATTSRLAKAGFVIDGLFGDYHGASWHEGADTWIVLARRA
jgi:SAM-dependent methyltransferase